MPKRTTEPVQLILFRHASTAWNEQGLYQGRRDIPLSPEGRNELSKISVPEVYKSGSLFASPLQRAVQTAEILFGRIPQLVPAAIEQNFGAWEGQSREIAIDAGWKGLDDRPPEGESIREVQARMKAWLQEFFEKGAPGILVTHKGVILAMTAMAMEWPAEGKKPFKIQSGKFHRFLVFPNGKLQVAELNMEFSSK